MRPNKLKLITIILCLFNLYGLIGLFFLNTTSDKFIYVVVAAIVVVIFSYVVIAFFWKGKNWARILVMLAALLSLPNIYNIRVLHIVSQFVMGIEFIFALYLLYWLNTKSVSEYFTNKAE